MKSKIEPNQIARTGRVQAWIDNPTDRLPVSCTIFNVQDSMEGTDGIEASWRFVSHALRYGAGVAVHQEEQQQIKDLINSLHQDLSHSEKSTQH